MPDLRERWFVLGVIALVATGITLPYLAAAQAAGSEHVFGGFLQNPLDGNSYLAKMRLGWEGEWRFRLPYTAEAGQGAYLFLFYLALGHLARLLSLPLLVVFHASRVGAAVILLVTLYRFFVAALPERRQARLAFALAALGSGMGWLALPAGAFTADFWVAEAYPFLSAYTNPHFPLGLALLLWLLMPAVRPEPDRYVKTVDNGARGAWKPRSQDLLVLAAAAALAVVSPFGLVIGLAVLCGQVVWRAIPQPEGVYRLVASLSPVLKRPSPLARRLFWMGIGGIPFLLYDIWVSHADALLANWNAQNLTPAPPPWDVVLSLSPPLLLAIFGLRRSMQHNPRSGRMLILWAVVGLGLLYLPLGLQRRFLLGVYVPLAALAVYGLDRLAGQEGSPSRYLFLALVLVLLALPTNLVILLAGGHGIQTRDPLLYLTREEAQALDWLAENTPGEALVLAAPETGLFIPAHSGRRVIYGHPFETANATAEKAQAAGFYQAGGKETGLLWQRGIDYVWVGPREQALSEQELSLDLPVAYQTGEVTVYSVPQR